MRKTTRRAIQSVKKLIGGDEVSPGIFPNWQSGYAVAASLLAAFARVSDRWLIIDALRGHASTAAHAHGQKHTADLEQLINFMSCSRSAYSALVQEATIVMLDESHGRDHCFKPVAELACRAADRESAHDFQAALAWCGLDLTEAFAMAGGQGAVDGLLAFLDGIGQAAVRKAG